MKKDNKELLTVIVYWALVLLLSSVVMKFLWNESLVKHISVLRPLKNYRDALLLTFALGAVKCCNP